MIFQLLQLLTLIYIAYILTITRMDLLHPYRRYMK